jgi:hypothetical protein
MHEAGVVSRVPRDSRHAQAWEMDRNTDQTSSTHQHGAGRQDERNDDGEDDRRYEERTFRRTTDEPQNLSWGLYRFSAGDGRDGSAFLTRQIQRLKHEVALARLVASAGVKQRPGAAGDRVLMA